MEGGQVGGRRVEIREGGKEEGKEGTYQREAKEVEERQGREAVAAAEGAAQDESVEEKGAEGHEGWSGILHYWLVGGKRGGKEEAGEGDVHMSVLRVSFVSGSTASCVPRFLSTSPNTLLPLPPSLPPYPGNDDDSPGIHKATQLLHFLHPRLGHAPEEVVFPRAHLQDADAWRQ